MNKLKENRLFFGFMAVLFVAAMIFSACSDDSTVKVTDVEFDGSETSVGILIGAEHQLTAIVSPSNASNKKVKWDSDRPAVATVSDKGLVTGIAVGVANITVTTNDGGKTASIRVNVSAPTPVNSITLDKTSVSMAVGNTETLVATITPASATDKTLTWTSSTPAVATVSDAGIITAVSAGTATITVTSHNDRTATCNVTVYTAGATLKVIFNKNHSDTSDFTEAEPAEMTVNVPAFTLESLPTAPTRSVYVFDGWYLTQDGTGDEFTASTVIPQAETTVYAKWKLVKTVTLDISPGQVLATHNTGGEAGGNRTPTRVAGPNGELILGYSANQMRGLITIPADLKQELLDAQTVKLSIKGTADEEENTFRINLAGNAPADWNATDANAIQTDIGTILSTTYTLGWSGNKNLNNVSYLMIEQRVDGDTTVTITAIEFELEL